jgi:hypothetical protein
MKHERFGSYSIDCTVAGDAVLRAGKSMMR